MLSVLESEGWDWRVYGKKSGRWVVRLWLESPTELFQNRAEGESLQIALCLAALKIKGVLI